MRTFNVSFLAVLSCVAMIGATPIGTRSLVEARQAESEGPQLYVNLQQIKEVLKFIIQQAWPV